MKKYHYYLCVTSAMADRDEPMYLGPYETEAELDEAAITLTKEEKKKPLKKQRGFYRAHIEDSILDKVLKNEPVKAAA